MKKTLILLLAVIAIASTSCKKDSETTPVSEVKVSQDKGNIGTWD